MGWLMISSIVFLLLPLSQCQPDGTIFNYTVFSAGGPSLIPQGSATVYPFFALLTDAAPNRAGRYVYPQPIRLWDRAGRRQANFQTRFRCYMGNGGSNNVMGDGISFFIAPVNTTIPAGSTGGNMGLYGSSGSSPTPLFAVELDVFSNTWDPSYRHVGININSRNSVAVDRWDFVGDNYVDVRITYDARQRLITAFASTFPPANAKVEHVFDLKTLLPESVQIGISASTSANAVVAQHGLVSWSFISFLVSDDVTNADH